jgi:hypothetical protein
MLVNRRNNGVKIGMLVLFCFLFSKPAATQILYSRHFARKVEKCQASFIRPVENWYKIKMLDQDPYMRYDLVLASEDKAFEMRFFLDHKYDRQIPHIDFFSLASSLAINEDHFDIHMHIFPTDMAHRSFQADWAGYADFVPKRSLTEKAYARLVSIYREGTGLMHTLLLFNVHDEEKDRRMYTLTFVEAQH